MGRASALILATTKVLTEQLVGDGVGTQLKNYTDQTGTAFDGTTSKDSNNCAYAGATSGYYGKTWSSAKTISKVQIWPASNTGFSFSGDPTITIYGKNGTAPASATDGTSLATTGSFTDQTTMKEVTIGTPAAYDHIWVQISAGTQAYIAQIRFYELA